MKCPGYLLVYQLCCIILLVSKADTRYIENRLASRENTVKHIYYFFLTCFIALIVSVPAIYFSGYIEARSDNPPFLEPQQVWAGTPTISWDGGGDGASWHDKNNWSGDRLPGASDEVLISVSGTPTINFTSAAGPVSIKSLICDEPLAIAGGSLTLNGLTSSQTTAGLTASGGTLNVSGSGTSFTAGGPTTLSNINLYAAGGGKIFFRGQ
jgi:hypothetical protein